MLRLQKQISATMSVKKHSAHRVAYKSDEDNCDNVFSNSGNSSNTDSSDNKQLHNLNALSRLGIIPITVFFLFQNHKI